MGAGEFDLIETYFAPLAAGRDGTFDLNNDGALLPAAGGKRLATTVDTLVEGVHFRPQTAPDALAAKALAVNLSDMAAMGACPLAYLLAVSFPTAPRQDWLEAFCGELARLQACYDIYLLGGDTTSTTGPLCLSVTLFGALAGDEALTRSGAGAGDGIYVSGSLGDAALGLVALGEGLPWLDAAQRASLVASYERPMPRVALGQALLGRGLATAAMDVSDGLIQDLGHMARHSGLAAIVERSRLPLSDAATAAVTGDPGLWPRLYGGGDDYELLFTAPPGRREALAALSRELRLPLTQIGRMQDGKGVRLLDASGRAIAVESAGWSHFS